MEEVELKVWLLADEPGQMCALQGWLDTKAVEPALLKKALEASEAVLVENILQYGHLEF